MDPRLLDYYEDELRHVRDMGAEFAARFPKIADRLGLREGGRAQDPYVEQLLQGFAFLAARVQLKVDAQFPRFTQHLLECVYPDYLAPTPSMTVVQMRPDLTQGDLREGPVVPRDTALLSVLGKGDRTPCEYRTAHEVPLWPLELVEVEYLANKAAVTTLGIAEQPMLRAGIRLRVRGTIEDLPLAELALERLPLYLAGADATPYRLYEQFLAHGLGMVALPTRRPAPWQQKISREHIRQVGITEEQALLPWSLRSFQGYRLLWEYFACPERFMFIELGDLKPAFQRCTDEHAIDIVVLLDHADADLEQSLKPGNIALFCTPAINLFPKRLDRIQLKGRESEHHAILDRVRSMDYEIYRLTEVIGHSANNRAPQRFLPFYASADHTAASEHNAYYAVHRMPRLPSQQQRREGLRSADGYEDFGYIGSEVFVALVDASEAPYRSDLQYLSLSALCTNRDLPLLWRKSVGRGPTDFTLEIGAPVESVRCLATPTAPRPSHAEREIAWRLISHLSLNYLSLLDRDDGEGAAAVRELLLLYADPNDAGARRQVDGVKAVRSEPVTRRMPLAGPITFGRGLRITVTLDEAAFEGMGVFLLGAVLDRFFAKYASINTFTQTVVETAERKVMTWPVRAGLRHTL